MKMWTATVARAIDVFSYDAHNPSGLAARNTSGRAGDGWGLRGALELVSVRRIVVSGWVVGKVDAGLIAGDVAGGERVAGRFGVEASQVGSEGKDLWGKGGVGKR
jgi:hypothetical protein